MVDKNRILKAFFSNVLLLIRLFYWSERSVNTEALGTKGEYVIYWASSVRSLASWRYVASQWHGIISVSGLA